MEAIEIFHGARENTVGFTERASTGIPDRLPGKTFQTGESFANSPAVESRQNLLSFHPGTNKLEQSAEKKCRENGKRKRKPPIVGAAFNGLNGMTIVQNGKDQAGECDERRGLPFGCVKRISGPS